jgi:uncharacterized membrane protein YedE/YeeE
MTDPTRVIAFFDIFGKWDATLAFVMGGALAVFSGGYFLLRQSQALPCDSRDAISKPLLAGALLFGVGWGLGGFCPGPAIANLGAPHMQAIVFVPAMALGMILVQQILKLDG